MPFFNAGPTEDAKKLSEDKDSQQTPVSEPAVSAEQPMDY